MDKEGTFFLANVELNAEHIYGLPATQKYVAANTEDLCNNLTNPRIFSQKKHDYNFTSGGRLLEHQEDGALLNLDECQIHCGCPLTTSRLLVNDFDLAWSGLNLLILDGPGRAGPGSRILFGGHTFLVKLI